MAKRANGSDKKLMQTVKRVDTRRSVTFSKEEEDKTVEEEEVKKTKSDDTA